MPLFLPPALVQAHPADAKLLHALSEALEGAPEALTDRRPARAKSEAIKALALWDRNQSAVLATLPATDQDALVKAMDRLRLAKGDEAGFVALDAMEILERRLPEGRLQWLAAADRLGMRGWILLGEGKTELPDLDAVFMVLMDNDGGKHASVVAKTRIELERYHAALAQKELPVAQKAVGVLLDLVDDFEK